MRINKEDLLWCWVLWWLLWLYCTLANSRPNLLLNHLIFLFRKLFKHLFDFSLSILIIYWGWAILLLMVVIFILIRILLSFVCILAWEYTCFCKHKTISICTLILSEYVFYFIIILMHMIVKVLMVSHLMFFFIMLFMLEKLFLMIMLVCLLTLVLLLGAVIICEVYVVGIVSGFVLNALSNLIAITNLIKLRSLHKWTKSKYSIWHGLNHWVHVSSILRSKLFLLIYILPSILAYFLLWVLHF